MKKVFLYLLPLFFILLFSFSISAATEFGYNNLGKPTLSRTVVNYTTVNTNSSDFWDALDTPLDFIRAIVTRQAGSEGLTISNAGGNDFSNPYFHITPSSDGEVLMSIGGLMEVGNSGVVLGDDTTTSRTIDGDLTTVRALPLGGTADDRIPMSVWGSGAGRTVPYFVVTNSSYGSNAKASDIVFEIDKGGNTNVNNNLTIMDSIVFNTTECNPSDSGGQLCWNSDKSTLNVVSGLGNVLQLGQEMTTLVKNTEGSTIYAGNIVTITGSVGEVPTAVLANSSDDAGFHIIAMVTLPSCNNNADCMVTKFGEVHDLNTADFTEGDPLYLNSTGGFTNIKPTFPEYNVHIGEVLRVHATTGIIDFHPELDIGDGVIMNSLKVKTNISTGDLNVTNRFNVMLTSVFEGDTTMNGNLHAGGNYLNNLSLDEKVLGFYTFATDNRDSSGNGYDGIVEGATYNSTGGFNGAGAYQFSNDKWINITDTVWTLEDDFTISYWVKFDNYNNYQGVLSSTTDTSANNGFWNEFGSTRGFTLFSNGVQILDDNVRDLTGLNTGEYYHVVITRTGDNITGYLNNSIFGTATSSATIGDSTNGLLMGRVAHTDSSLDLTGALDNVRITKKGSTQKEVERLYLERPYESTNTGLWLRDDANNIIYSKFADDWLNVTNRLSVMLTSIFEGDVTMNGNLSVNGDITVGNPSVVPDSHRLSIHGDSSYDYIGINSNTGSSAISLLRGGNEKAIFGVSAGSGALISGDSADDFIVDARAGDLVWATSDNERMDLDVSTGDLTLQDGNLMIQENITVASDGVYSTGRGLNFGDGNTGFYESADNILNLRVAGSDSMQFRSGGLFKFLTWGARATGNSFTIKPAETVGATNPALTISNEVDLTGTNQSIMKVYGDNEVTMAMDLMANGNLEIAGNFTGNDFYGELWNSSISGSTHAITGAGDYINITDGTQCGSLNGFSCTAGKLTAGVSGAFKVEHSLSFDSIGGDNDEFISSIGVNGIPQEKCLAFRDTGTGSLIGSMTMSCIVDISTGDIVTYMVQNVDDADDLNVRQINLNMIRVGN